MLSYDLITPVVNVAYTTSPDEFVDEADYVLHVTVSETFEERKFKISYHTDSPEDGMEEFFTETEVEVLNVLDNRSKNDIAVGDNLHVREPYVLEGDRILHLLDSHAPLQAESEYILLLEDSDVTLGTWTTFNVDGSDPYNFLFHPDERERLAERLAYHDPDDVVEPMKR
ncbi:hypothetical protein [Geomicrobium sp. JCM 19037]|uniref:hypothetical protein n=1 Tax=Geomicrobium sp. JCM 19037 TaxID=1460634 RepID=UPI0005A94134|nr:hypothetical protein [Geomicrobium sp. JCM 19037]